MFGLVPLSNKNVRKAGDTFNDLFADFVSNDFFNSFENYGGFKADIKETKDGYLVDAELPGVDKKDISIEYKNNILTISAKKSEEKNEKNEDYIRKERVYGDFKRSFNVENVKEELIKAKFENGVLNIELPKEDKNDESYKIKIS
ncbi:MAG: Hsp20/alpha crystallin family protein [Clostridiales bacterium]|nr:Hsp20/alpha crystallin family protein [Clostridiales bacterium]